MNLGLRRGAVLAGALGAMTLSAATLAPGAGAAAAGAGAPTPRVTLAQGVPSIPADATRLGSVPSGQVLTLDVTLSGQNPAGLAQAVAAVSTPGSPEYHHYLTSAQYAAEFGPSSAEVALVSTVLRGEGLTVGTPDPGSSLLPVRGTAGTVAAAFATPLESVQAPNRARTVVNTAPPQIPASLAGAVTAVVGLDGLFQEHSMLRRGPAAAPTAATATTNAVGPGNPVAGVQGHDLVSHASTPQACPAAIAGASGSGGYTSTQMATTYGLDQVFSQGRTGLGQTIGIVEFDQFSPSDVTNFQSCYGLSNPVQTVLVDGGPRTPTSPDPEPAIDIELASVNAPSASIVVYEAPNSMSDVSGIDLFNRIASDNIAQVVTTSWGNCEADIPSADIQSEGTIFSRMALQGQTMIAAAGDSGSEDCYSPANGVTDTALAVDDPGSQPTVVSAGGTTLPTTLASSQVVWNDCFSNGINLPAPCAIGHGAGGGGLSTQWARPTYQQAANPSAQRAVPDISGSADPNHGVVMYFGQFGGWVTFGGTSIVSPANAGFFADTNQGCFTSIGQPGPALYLANNSSNFTDITSGNNDLTDSHSGLYHATAGYDPASGLGTPIDQNLSIALQGAAGCPSVASVSPDTGPVSGGGAITVTGGGFLNASSVVFGSAGAGRIVSQSENAITVVPPNAEDPLCVDVTVRNPQGISVTSPADHYGFGGDLNCGQGYRFVASDGGIFDYGNATFWGSTGSLHLNAPMVGMAVTPSTNGYWMVASDGGIFTFGDAPFYGSMGGQHLNRPIVGMASVPSGGGYWLVAADGGIFTFGKAQFFGSTGGIHLNKPVVGMAATPDGGGYWLVASDGGIFSYGDAHFYGSTGSLVLNSPVVGMAAGPGGNGYWLVASDGGIFDYGSAGFFGSAGSIHLNQPVVGMASTPDSKGYWLVAADGGIFTYGDALFYGSTGSIRLNKPIVGMSST